MKVSVMLHTGLYGLICCYCSVGNFKPAQSKCGYYINVWTYLIENSWKTQLHVYRCIAFLMTYIGFD